MARFKWGDSFYQLNGDYLEQYAQCTDGASVVALQNQFLANLKAEAADRHEAAATQEMDLPPEDSEDEYYDSSGGEYPEEDDDDDRGEGGLEAELEAEYGPRAGAAETGRGPGGVFVMAKEEPAVPGGPASASSGGDDGKRYWECDADFMVTPSAIPQPTLPQHAPPAAHRTGILRKDLPKKNPHAPPPNAPVGDGGSERASVPMREKKEKSSRYEGFAAFDRTVAASLARGGGGTDRAAGKGYQKTRIAPPPTAPTAAGAEAAGAAGGAGGAGDEAGSKAAKAEEKARISQAMAVAMQSLGGMTPEEAAALEAGLSDTDDDDDDSDGGAGGAAAPAVTGKGGKGKKGKGKGKGGDGAKEAAQEGPVDRKAVRTMNPNALKKELKKRSVTIRDAERTIGWLRAICAPPPPPPPPHCHTTAT
jgi:hypothetical protein